MISGLFNQADAQTLIGGVTVNDSVPQAELKALSPKIDEAKLPFKKDCICFDRNKIELKQIDGSWKLVEKDHWILDFAQRDDFASSSYKLIQDYKMDEICFVGRNTGKAMMYFLSDGQAPRGAGSQAEDLVSFDNGKIKAENIGGNWKVTCRDMWLQDFGKSEADANDAAAVIKYYGFDRQCFVGRPGAPMEYYLKAN